MCLGPSVFRKSRKSQTILKISDKKKTQETSLGWKKALPTALLHTLFVPKELIVLSPYEMLYGRPFVHVNDLLLDPEAQTQRLIPWPWGNSKRYMLWAVNWDPQDSKEPPLYAPRTQVLIKVWKDESPKAQLQPT